MLKKLIKSEFFLLYVIIILFASFLTLALWMGYIWKQYHKESTSFNDEYQIELVNTSKVLIKNTETNTIYTCKPNEVDSILWVDNL